MPSNQAIMTVQQSWVAVKAWKTVEYRPYRQIRVEFHHFLRALVWMGALKI